MASAKLKDLAKTKKLKVGHFIVEFATPGIGHIMKSAGCDFVLFDMEHSGFGFETVKSAMRYFEAAELPTIVRVPSKEYHHIARACDMGAEGIMLPMVGTAEEARHILDCMKYHPDGKRGVALQVAHDNYRGGAVPDKLANANERTTFFARSKPPRASRTPMPSPRSMASTACGSAISISRLAGHPRRIRQSEIPQGDRQGHCRHPQAWQGARPAGADGRAGRALYTAGFDFICYSGDVWVLHNALTEAVTQLRAAAEEGLSDGQGAVPRRTVGRFQESRRHADLPGFRHLAAAEPARRRIASISSAATRSAPSSWPMSMR